MMYFHRVHFPITQPELHMTSTRLFFPHNSDINISTKDISFNNLLYILLTTVSDYSTELQKKSSKSFDSEYAVG